MANVWGVATRRPFGHSWNAAFSLRPLHSFPEFRLNSLGDSVSVWLITVCESKTLKKWIFPIFLSGMNQAVRKLLDISPYPSPQRLCNVD